MKFKIFYAAAAVMCSSLLVACSDDNDAPKADEEITETEMIVSVCGNRVRPSNWIVTW